MNAIIRARSTLPAIMLSAMIGFYGPIVQAQGDTPVEAASERRAEHARAQAAEEALNRSGPAPVVEAEPAFERAIAQVGQTGGDPDADNAILSTRLPDRLPIMDDSGNTAFFEVEITPDTRVVEREWIMLIRASQRSALEEQAPDLMDFLTGSQPFESIDSEILIFTVPPSLDADNAILELVPSDMRHLIDRNHIYSVEADEDDGPFSRTDSASLNGSVLRTPLKPVCEDPLGIGIIDSTIMHDHPAFRDMNRRDTAIISRDFIDHSLERPKGHGTAVAGLLAGTGDGLEPLLPGATLYNAGVVYSRDTFHKGATARHLLQALDWLITQDVQVINMSLAGPPNRLLSQGIEAAVNSGRFVVAAVGNEGPHAPAQYPAAYEFVISATAVDEQRSIYRWANQGDYVDFAALGVSVPTARGDGTVGRESGTSIAAPVISAFLACALVRHRRNASAALMEMKNGVTDLGEPGYDPVFGHGLLHPDS